MTARVVRNCAKAASGIEARGASGQAARAAGGCESRGRQREQQTSSCENTGQAEMLGEDYVVTGISAAMDKAWQAPGAGDWRRATGDGRRAKR